MDNERNKNLPKAQEKEYENNLLLSPSPFYNPPTSMLWDSLTESEQEEILQYRDEILKLQYSKENGTEFEKL